MNVVEFFASRPRLASVAALAVLIAGAISVPLLPVALYPTLARPAISVTCNYPGASAVELMNTVAGPMEEKVNGVEGMDYMTSSCYDNGAYSLTVNFEVGYDRDTALMKVQSKVQQAMSLLPQEVKNTGVTVESGTTEELGILTLRSRDGKLSHDQVADYVFGVVNPAVLRVAGVGKSTVKDDKLAVRVWMKPEMLAARGLNTEDVVAAVKAQNVQASLGTLGSRPSEDSGGRVLTLISKGRLSSPEEFGEIIVATDPQGGLVRLRDVAEIGMGPQGYSYSSLYGETPSVYIVLYLLPGANPLTAMAEVKAELRKLEPFFPADLAWDMSYDSTDYIYAALRGAATAAAFALLAMFAALWIALRSLRAALLAAASVAVPACASAAVLLAAGGQVNVLGIYAFAVTLAFASGLSAWSVIRVRTGRLPGREQLAAAAMVVAAAIPLALMDGVQGALFRQFSIVLAVMAPASVFTSTLLVPVAARRLLRPQVAAAATGASLPDAPQSDWRGGLAAPVAAILVVLAGLAAYVVYRSLPKTFVPGEDMGYLYVDCKLAEGTPMEATADVMRRIYRDVSSMPGVAKAVTLLGDSTLNGSGENLSKMLVVLKDWRERGAGESTQQITKRIQELADDIPEAEIFALRMPPVKGIGNQGGLTVRFQPISDNDPVKFSRETLRMLGELRKSPLVESVNGGFYVDTPHLRIRVDRAKCELMKVPMSSIFTVLQHNLGSIYVNDVNLGTQVNRVTAMSEWSGRASAEDIRGLYVRSKTGEMVPLDTLVTWSEELGPHACYRCNQFLYCTEQFLPKPGVSESEAIAEVRRICREKLSPGFLNDWLGLTYESMKSRGDEGLLFALSLVLAYLVAVAFRESWRRALCDFAPSVAAVLGALLALWATGVQFSAYSRYALSMLAPLATAMSFVADGRPRARYLLPLLGALAMLPLCLAAGAGAVGARTFAVALAGGFSAYALVVFRRPRRMKVVNRIEGSKLIDTGTTSEARLGAI